MCSYEVRQVIDAWDAVGVGLGQYPANLKFDLALKDNLADTYADPNLTAGSNWTNSEDIWVRNNPYHIPYAAGLRHQNPRIGLTDLSGNILKPMVRTRIKNLGCSKTSGTETLSVYWSMAGTWIGWPNYFDGRHPIVGNLVGSASIPSLKPGESTIVNVIWDPSRFPQVPSGGGLNVSILARIDGGSKDPIQEYPLNQIHNLVIANNNVALKNLTVINPLIVDPNAGSNWGVPSFLVRNVGSTNSSFDFQFKSELNLIEQCELYFVLPSEIYNQIGDFSNHIGIEEHPVFENTILLTDSFAVLKNIDILGLDTFSIQPNFNFLSTEVADVEYKFHISQIESNSSTPLGSVNYMIERPSRIYFEVSSGDDIKVIKGKSISVLAEDIGEDAEYNWYDAGGNLVYTGQSLSLTAEESEALMLEVITDSDDYKDYDETNIIVTLGLINSIYPLPAQNNTNFEVEISSSATTSSLIIYSTMNTPVNTYVINSTGISTVNANLNSLPAGIYKAALIVNGTVADIKQFVKL